jgi:hypothetical protein
MAKHQRFVTPQNLLGILFLGILAGPLSDLERYPTTNLKFDKEIPDVFEFLFLGAGRLVLHVTEERKAIVLDNVLFINSKEIALKRLMSRMEVRVTTDQEVSQD